MCYYLSSWQGISVSLFTCQITEAPLDIQGHLWGKKSWAFFSIRKRKNQVCLDWRCTPGASVPCRGARCSAAPEDGSTAVSATRATHPCSECHISHPGRAGALLPCTILQHCSPPCSQGWQSPRGHGLAPQAFPWLLVGMLSLCSVWHGSLVCTNTEVS